MEKKLIFQAKIRIGTLSCCTYNFNNFSRKLSQIVFEGQHSPDLENTDSKEEASCLKWTNCFSRSKLRVNFNTDTDKLNIVV